jgi:predicted phosphodiesterase
MMPHGKTTLVGAAIIALALAAVSFSLLQETGEQQVWWILTDPHVGGGGYEYLRAAVEDVNELQIADYAIVLGDLVADSIDHVSRFLEMMDNLGVREWHYILGNHDYHQTTNENVLPVVYKGIDVVGMRFILISDEKGGPHYSGGVMSDEQFDWLWEELYGNRDKHIFIFSHQPYYGWNTWNDIRPTVEDVGVDIWFAGHQHRWNIENTEHGFMSFVVNSIDWNKQGESIFLFVKSGGGEVEVEIKARDHLEGVWLAEPYSNFVFKIPKGSSTAHAGLGLNPAIIAAAIAAGVTVFNILWGKSSPLMRPKSL